MMGPLENIRSRKKLSRLLRDEKKVLIAWPARDALLGPKPPLLEFRDVAVQMKGERIMAELSNGSRLEVKVTSLWTPEESHA